MAVSKIPQALSREDLFSVLFVAVAAFGGTLYLFSSQAPGQVNDPAQRALRGSDQHYAGCDRARANGHENIARSEPSYREWMDGDSDGLACEPVRR